MSEDITKFDEIAEYGIKIEIIHGADHNFTYMLEDFINLPYNYLINL